MAAETQVRRLARTTEIVKRLHKRFREARTALTFSTPLELLIATIMSAQTTDVNVNRITPALFAKYRSAADWAALPQAQLESEIKASGFFRQKSKAIRATCQILVDKFGGQVPRDMDQLLELPGVARKTANVVLGSAFGIAAGVVVDRHVARVTGRLKLTTHADPVKIEQDLMQLVPQKDWIFFGHALVLHGRATCTARKPDCEHCALNDVCPSAFTFGTKRQAKSD